ncbi:MAG: glutathione synthase [Myxococcota bacterium]|nr:glutathione synthase [Myxococcota bacterium]
MSKPALRLAFVMDPIESISVAEDTTFVIMLEAQNRGHRVFYVDPAHLGVRSGQVEAVVTEVTLRREVGNHVDLGESRRVVLDEEIDVAFQRVDPPVDENYRLATQMLALCRRTRVLNRPESILAYNEKLFALQFRELMTETAVTRSIPELRDLLSRMGGEMIVKPLDGKGGEGIFHVREGDPNVVSILEQATGFGHRWTMAQRYLPEVREGDKRILLLEGEPLGAVLRVPAEGETRANLHVGGRAQATELDDQDRRIVAAVGPVLAEQGLFFVGLDVIGGCLTEINVTSPTGVQEVDALEDCCLEGRILDRVEALVGEGRSG